MKSSIAGLLFLLCLDCAAARPRNGTLVVAVSPAEGGTPDGSGTYPGRTKVTIRAVPFPGWAFSKWSDGNTNSERTVTVPNGGTARYTATVVFVPHGTISLAAEPVIGGIVSGSGSFPVGQAVDIMATPYANWSFLRWQDYNADHIRTVVVPQGAMLFTATFTTNTPPVPVFTNGTVTLDWPPGSNAVQYVASWGVASRGYTNSVVTSNLNVRIVGLVTNKTYYFAVQSMALSGRYSPFSCEVFALPGQTNACSP